MGEREFAEYLINLLSQEDIHAERFFDKCIMTQDEGVVVETEGHTFYVTIQQVR